MEKNIKVDEDLWSRLQQEKIAQRYKKISDLIKDKINFVEKFSNEKEFVKWFENNFTLLGFSKILEKRISRFPDFKMEMDGKELEVELETLSSNFIRHKHDPEKCDFVVCLLEDIRLPVKTIEIKTFEFLRFNARFGCEVNKKILEEFIKTFDYAGRKNGDTIKSFIENSMKKRIENFNKK